MSSDKSRNKWLVDNSRVRVDAGLIDKVMGFVAVANQKFRTSILHKEEQFFPYFFDIREASVKPESEFSAESYTQKTKMVFASDQKKLTTEEARKLVFEAIRDKAIVRSSEDKRLISPNGGKNVWLIDMRRIFLDAQLLDAVAELFWKEFSDKLPFQVGGMEVAAIPLLSAILLKSVERGTPVNGFIVRKERKMYGEGKLYEGVLTAAPIVIVDDLLNSGASLEKVRVILEDEKRAVSEAFVVIDYDSAAGQKWRADKNVNVSAPFKLSDFDLVVNKPKPNEILPPLFFNAWNFKSPDPNFFQRVPKSFPITDGRRIYFGSDSGYFWCLNAADGALVWNFKLKSDGHKNIWSAPALHGGKVYFGGYDGNLYCLESETGKEIWRFEEADWVGSSPALAPDLELLFVGLEFGVEGKRGSIIALDMNTGERVWEHKTKRYTHASPAYWPEQKLVACGSNDNEMFLFDAASGILRWRFETKGESEKGSIRHAPAFDPKREQLVTGCADGYIYIINLKTGKESWSVKTDNTIYTVPLVVGDLAFIGSTDKHMYVLDLEKRNVMKKIPVYSKVYAPPRLIEGKIYFGACSGMIYEIDPVTAETTGTHQLPDSITNAMTYSPQTRMFYALTYVNQLFAMTHL